MARAREKEKGRAAPLRVATAPLHELSRDELSVFLYVALLPEETRALVKELGLTVPGFRTEALGDVERCDVIADEILLHPASAELVLGALAKAFESPPLPRLSMEPAEWEELLRLCGSDSALAAALWRALSDRDAKVRQAAAPVLDDLARHYYGPPEGGAEGGAGEGEEPPPEEAADLERSLERAEARLRESEARAAERAGEARRKAEEQREKLQSALREARAGESRAAEEAARAREDASEARRESARLRSELEAIRASDASVEAQRLRSEARDLGGRVHALEARLERVLRRGEELEAELSRSRAGEDAKAQPPIPEPAGEGAEGEPGESEATFLLPVYTREFYDSLDGWDRRIQRAAFKQAHLLALDHRHPSLRALPLEGLPGYYRVRVATDVRLIYRRAERQNTVEVLSLIDREDLDRYIRQAKTRG